MTASAQHLEHLLELLAGAGPVIARRMFGGAGLYADGIMFALVANDILYLKADAETEPRFRDAGMIPFTYTGRGKAVVMSYWRAPEHLYDEPDEMVEWARAAMAAARRAQAKKPATPASPAGPRRKLPTRPK
ncbi:MAG: TfoX/Sxy family protein [Hyphomicrobiaceae bacterium]|nr:TfoX/Sxy family protein [Hyphomicrobiaceae bacterium]